MDYELLTVEMQRNGFKQRLQILESDIFEKGMELAELEAIAAITKNPADKRKAMTEVANLKTGIEYTKIRLQVTKEAMATLPETPAT